MQINLLEEFGISNTMSKEELNSQIKIAIQKSASWKNHPNIEKQRKANENYEMLQLIKKCVDENSQSISVKEIVNTIQKALLEDAFDESFDLETYYKNNKFKVKMVKETPTDADNRNTIRKRNKDILVDILNWNVSPILSAVILIGFLILTIDLNKNYSGLCSKYKNAYLYILMLVFTSAITIVLNNYIRIAKIKINYSISPIYNYIRYLIDTVLFSYMGYHAVKIFIFDKSDMGYAWFKHLFALLFTEMSGILFTMGAASLFGIFFFAFIAIPIIIILLLAFVVLPMLAIYYCIYVYFMYIRGKVS